MDWKKWESPQALMRAARAAIAGDCRSQKKKRQTRYARDSGPMYYLGQQIVRQMQMAGRDAKISECFRSPARQAELYNKGRTSPGPIVTNAPPGSSPHQFYLAVDIIHPDHGWNVDPEYWETLAACVRVVSEKFGVPLDHGHHWRFTDSAHIELEDWRSLADQIGRRTPTPDQLESWFRRFLPDV